MIGKISGACTRNTHTVVIVGLNVLQIVWYDLINWYIFLYTPGDVRSVRVRILHSDYRPGEFVYLSEKGHADQS